MRHIRILSTLACLLAVACGESPRASTRPSVVLVCIDTLRADHLGAYGYGKRPTSPALDRLAQSSTLFEDVSATSGWTKPSVPSFLTGTYPLQHGVYEGSTQTVEGETSHVLSDQAVTLAEVFSSGGWRTAAFVRNAQLNLGNGFEQGFDLYRDQAGDAREIRWQALDWIDADASGQPFFLYLHFLDAHWPYPIPDEAALRFVEPEDLTAFRSQDWKDLRDAINDGEQTPTADELELLLGLYDAGIRYVDDQLGAFFDGLEQRGLYDDTIVCVISDHGEEFMEHGVIGHGHGLYENLLQVPWILRVPRGERRRVASPVSLVDVFPTLLGLGGLELPGGLAGELAGADRLARPAARTPILAEHKEPDAYQQSLRDGSRKLIRRFRQREGLAGAAIEPVPGGRWEVELSDDLEEGLLARSMELLDEPADDPFEIKGPIRGLERDGEGGRFSLCGFEVRFAGDTEVYGEVPEGADLSVLAEGLPVKAKGDWHEGALVADKLKLYDPADELELELRGKLEELEADDAEARLRLGPVWIRHDGQTSWDLGLLEDEGSPLPREALAELVLEPAGRQDRFELERSCYDLSADPREQSPSSEGCNALGRALDELGSQLAGRSFHGGTRMLDEAVLDELRELGYVR